MARAAITVNTIPANGGKLNSITKTAGDAANDHTMANDGRTLLIIQNLDAAPKTVTIVSVADEYGRTGDVSVVVPAASAGDPGIGIAGPFRVNHFNQAGGVINIDITDATSLKFAAVQYNPPS